MSDKWHDDVDILKDLNALNDFGNLNEDDLEIEVNHQKWFDDSCEDESCEESYTQMLSKDTPDISNATDMTSLMDEIHKSLISANVVLEKETERTEDEEKEKDESQRKSAAEKKKRRKKFASFQPSTSTEAEWHPITYIDKPVPFKIKMDEFPALGK